MKDALPFIVIGVASGSLFGLAAVGLVLTFKATGVFNLAHGAVAAVAAYAFYDLHEDRGLPWPIALVLTVALVGVVGGLVVDRVAGAVSQARPILAIVATVGLLLAIQGGLTVRYGASSLAFPGYLPRGSVELAGVDITYEQIIVSAVGLVAVALLVAYFRVSRTGLAMRAVVDDPALLALAATAPRRVRMTAWIIGSSFAALSGVLIGPTIGRDPSRLTLLVIQAFGAAAIGRFSSLPWTYAGGLAIGVTASLTTHWVADQPGLAGLPTSVPFLVLFVALLVTPSHRLAVRTAVARARPSRVGRSWSPPTRVGVLVAVGIMTVLVPELVDAKLPVYLNAAVLTPMLLSLGLLTWTSNQISLCHAAFVAVGATSFAHLSHAGVPWLPALLLGAAAAVPLGAFVAVPAIRLSGVYLALATFGFGLVVQRLLYPAGIMFGDLGFRAAPRPDFAFIDGASDRWYFAVVVAIAVACAAVVAAVQRSRLGRLLRALGDSPDGLSALGADANVARLLVFCLASFLAALTGGLSIAATTQASVDTFGLFQSLLWLSVLVICGSNLLVGAPLAALLLAVGPSYLPDAVAEYQPIGFGVAALLVAALLDREYGLGRRSAGRGSARRRAIASRLPPRRPRRCPRERRRPRAGRADRRLRRSARRRRPRPHRPHRRDHRAHRPQRRREDHHLQRVQRVRPPHRQHRAPARGGRQPRRGGGTGPSRSRPHLPAHGAVRVDDGRRERGPRAGVGGGGPQPASPAAPPPSRPCARSAAATDALGRCGIGGLADRSIGSLSTGQRRLVELARVVAGPFTVLLLDEPSSGLDEQETDAFAALLLDLLAERPLAILLVEHDLPLVLGICARIHVVDFGKLLLAGTPAEVRASEAVRAAYLGADAAVPR